MNLPIKTRTCRVPNHGSLLLPSGMLLQPCSACPYNAPTHKDENMSRAQARQLAAVFWHAAAAALSVPIRYLPIKTRTCRVPNHGSLLLPSGMLLLLLLVMLFLDMLSAAEGMSLPAPDMPLVS